MSNPGAGNRIEIIAGAEKDAFKALKKLAKNTPLSNSYKLKNLLEIEGGSIFELKGDAAQLPDIERFIEFSILDLRQNTGSTEPFHITLPHPKHMDETTKPGSSVGDEGYDLPMFYDGLFEAYSDYDDLDPLGNPKAKFKRRKLPPTLRQNVAKRRIAEYCIGSCM